MTDTTAEPAPDPTGWYDRENTYVTWGGTLGSAGQEIWQCGIRLAPGAAGDSASFPTTTQANTLLMALSTQWTSTANQTMRWVKWSWLKFSRQDVHGLLKGDPLIATTTPPSGIAGPQSTISHPFQIAQCVTLWSGQTFGKGNYGRFYLPGPAYNIGDDGAVSGTVENACNWVGAWLKTIENSAASWPDGSSPMYISIMHKAAAQSSARTRRVAQVRVGNVMDTQRRRRNHLNETYSQATTYP